MLARLALAKEKAKELRDSIALAHVEIVKLAGVSTVAQRKEQTAHIKRLTAQYFDQVDSINLLQRAVERFDEYQKEVLNKNVKLDHERS